MTVKSEFEIQFRMGIGQYIPTGSMIHRLDPRVKLFIGALLLATLIISRSLLSMAFLLLAVISGFFLLRGGIKMALRALKPVVPFMFLLAIIQVFAIPQLRADARFLWEWGILKITDRSLLSGALLIFRFVNIVLGLSLLSLSTSNAEFLHGMEHLLRPLQRLRFPAHELSLVINISIRFLPILMEETEKLLKAQASRGADFGYGKRMRFLKKLRKMLPLFVPLFIISLRHAYNLVEAMEARCYMGGRNRTHLIRLRTGLSDYMALALGLGISTVALFMSFWHIDSVIWNMFYIKPYH